MAASHVHRDQLHNNKDLTGCYHSLESREPRLTWQINSVPSAETTKPHQSSQQTNKSKQNLKKWKIRLITSIRSPITKGSPGRKVMRLMRSPVESDAGDGLETAWRRPGDGLETRRNRAETGPRPGRRPGRLRQWEMGPDGVVREQPVAAMGDPLGAIEVSPGGNRGRGTVRPLAPGETGARPGVEIVRGRPGRGRGWDRRGGGR